MASQHVIISVAGTSVQNMVHWAQGVRRKVEDTPKMAKYDYGKECSDPFGNPRACNQDMYGSEDPPVYILKDIKTPIAIFSGMSCLAVAAPCDCSM